MRPKLIAAAAASLLLAVVAAPASAASIWTPVASGTSASITGIEYQSDSRLWFVTSAGEIFTRQGDGTFSRRYGPTAIPLNDIAFQPGGSIGFAVGNNGQVLRSTDSGQNWANVNPGGTPIPVSKAGGSGPCTATQPLGDVTSVRFAGPDRVWIMGPGAQLARSQAPDVGAVGTWVDANRDTHGTVDPADDTCRLATSYADGTGDVFFATPDVGWFCTAFFGETFFTANGLASSGAKQAGDCGNGDTPARRITGDPADPSSQWAISAGGLGTSYTARTTDAWATSDRFRIANPDAHAFATPYDIASAGKHVIAVGDAGTIVNSIDGATFFHNPATGAIATTDWRAVDMASPTQAAIGGSGGTLALTSAADTVPDLTAPSGTISGPGSVVAGQAAGFTANVADEPGGSGIDPGSIAWSVDGVPVATGNPASLTFPTAGLHTVTVAFKDNAGNAGTATLGVAATTAPSGGGTGVTGTIAPGTPNPLPTKTITVAGGRVTLSGPRTCVGVGRTFSATLSFKRSRRKGTRFVKVTRVDFSVDGRRVKIDRRAPFRQRLSVRSYAPSSRHTLKARAFIKVKRGKAPKKSITTAFQVCAS